MIRDLHQRVLEFSYSGIPSMNSRTWRIPEWNSGISGCSLKMEQGPRDFAGERLEFPKKLLESGHWEDLVRPAASLHRLLLRSDKYTSAHRGGAGRGARMWWERAPREGC